MSKVVHVGNNHPHKSKLKRPEVKLPVETRSDQPKVKEFLPKPKRKSTPKP